MGKGLDWGTATVVVCQLAPDKEDPTKMVPTYRTQRNCYVEVPADEPTRRTIEKADMSYVELGGDDGMLYVIGEHAMELAGMMSTQGVEIRRPMAAGVMQGDTKATRIMQGIASSVLGEPGDDRLVVYSIPAAPIDDPTKTIVHHQTMTETALRRLGWDPRPIPEGLAVIYSMQPKMINDLTGKEVDLTGVGISFGGGMVNVCVAYRGMPTINFSVANALGMNQGAAGDWIDRQFFNTYGGQMGSMAQCTLYKEKFADFTRIRTILTKEDDQNLQAYAKEVSKKSHICRNDANWHYEVLSSLRVWYYHQLQWVVARISDQFEAIKPTIDGALEIVVTGGTSAPPGFENVFEELLEKEPLPFEISGIRKSDKPLWTVARGCFAAAEIGYGG